MDVAAATSFFSDVQDAPQIIRDTAAELHLLVVLLETFRQIIAALQLEASQANLDLAGARAAVLLLGDALGRLTRLVVKDASVIAPTTGRRVYKTWKALDHAWRRPQLRESLQRLQQAKVLLLMAQSNLLLSQNTVQTALLTQHGQGMRVAFRQQRSQIRKTVTNALQIASHQTYMLPNNRVSSAEPLLPLLEPMSHPSGAIVLSQTSTRPRRRRVAILPTWEDDIRIDRLTSRSTRPDVPQFTSILEDSWFPVTPGWSSSAALIPNQGDARVLRQRSRRAASRLRNSKTVERAIRPRRRGSQWISPATAGGILVLTSGTAIISLVQTVIQLKQAL